MSKACSVSIEINGIFLAKHIPLAVATPMRKPVYDPGPEEIETAETASNEIEFLENRKFYWEHISSTQPSLFEYLRDNIYN